MIVTIKAKFSKDVLDEMAEIAEAHYSTCTVEYTENGHTFCHLENLGWVEIIDEKRKQ